MTVFLSTEDGRILLAQLDTRRHSEMADFDIALTDIAITVSGQLLGTDGRLVYRLDMGAGSATPFALISSADVVSIDSDGAERAIIGTASGQIWRQEKDGSLTDIGQFAGGIDGMARIGGFAFAATQAGEIAVMNLLDGSVEVLLAHGLGPVDAISADGKMLRLTVDPPSSTPQFFLFDPKTLSLTHETGLLNFYDDVTGAASGDLGTITFQGGGGDEEFIGTALDDRLLGMDGDDRVYARDGNDTINGGAGDDLILGEAGFDVIEGGAGDDLINGGNGNDWAVFSTAAATVDLGRGDPQSTGAGIDQILAVENLRGSDFADSLSGNSGANILEGQGGKDTLVARQGDDTLRGGGGNDRLKGDGGDDILNGGAGFDTADYSGALAVEISLALEQWQATGGAGRDRLISIEKLVGSDGDDTLGGNAATNRLEGGWGDDILQGGAGDDSLIGMGDDDSLHGGSGSDRVNGGYGNDTLIGGLGEGEDTAIGGEGADVFVFVVVANDGRSQNRLTIEDFDAAQGDLVDLVGLGRGSFDRWTITSENGGTDALIRFQNNTEILFNDMDATEIRVDWFF